MKANDFEGRRNISGERVRMRRLRLRLSQAALAARSRQRVYCWSRMPLAGLRAGQGWFRTTNCGL